VGTGQSEVEVAAAADTTVVLEAPEMGDEVQAIKAGLLEVADIVVVNKGDRPGAQRTASQLRAMLVASSRVASADGHHGSAQASTPGPATSAPASLRSSSGQRRPKEPLVMVTTATSGAGVAALLDALDTHRTQVAAAPDAPARLARAESEVWSIVGDRVRQRLLDDGHRAETDAVLRAVASHELDPFGAADRLLAERRG